MDNGIQHMNIFKIKDDSGVYYCQTILRVNFSACMLTGGGLQNTVFFLVLSHLCNFIFVPLNLSIV